jgi:serine/threonine-protein kinase
VGHVAKEASEDVPKGRVVAQDPDPMSTLPPGDPVDLTVSTGQPDVVVPDILGDDKDTARQKLTDAGLQVKLVQRKSDETKDIVVDSNPRPATSVSKGSLVTVYYSAGPKQVPSVVGLKEGAARAKLEKAGFKVDTVTDSQTQAQKGTVLKQSPQAFTTQPQGTTVVITVSAYEPPSETPTPTPSPTPTETTPPTESPSLPPTP